MKNRRSDIVKKQKVKLIDELPKWNSVEPHLEYNKNIAKQMALFSALAYLSDNKSVVKTHLKNYENIKKIYFFDNNGTEAMMFKCGKSIVLSLRGTEPTELKDIISDLNIIPRNGEKQGLVHRGFAKALDNIWDDVETTLDALYRAGDVVYITGHSLGGALATVAAARSKYIAQVYTYGQPRVGDKTYSKNVKSKIYRHVHRADIVPSVPFGLLYKHIGEIYYVDMGCCEKVESLKKYSTTRLKKQWGSVLSRKPLWSLVSDHSILDYYLNI